MSITGEPDGPPQKVGVAISDLFTGLYGVIAIEAALIARERTGRGQRIDLALFDSMSAMLANQAMNYLASGRSPRRMGNAHLNLAPYQTFPVADGWLIVAVGNDGQFERLCAVLGLEGMAGDPRFATNPGAGDKPGRDGARAQGEDASAGSATTCSPRWRRPSFRPARSTRSPTCSPIRSSRRAACGSSRRGRPAFAARS